MSPRPATISISRSLARTPEEKLCIDRVADALVARYTLTGGPDELEAMADLFEAFAPAFGPEGRARWWTEALRQRAADGEGDTDQREPEAPLNQIEGSPQCPC